MAVPVAGYTSDELAAPTDNRPGQRAADWTRGCRFSRASGESIVKVGARNYLRVGGGRGPGRNGYCRPGHNRSGHAER